MSGIVGQFRFDGKQCDPEDTERMLQRISHRGPDGEDCWSDRSVTLGHQHFQTTPEAMYESLPFERDDLVITADARIDNRTELIEATEVSSGRSGVVTDTQLIVAAYERWGEDCPDRLCGAFAFAIWDPAERRLFCARDHMGIRPFYYHCSSERFVFASEIKSLTCLDEVPRWPDGQRIADFLVGQYGDETQTFHQHIHRIPPGSTVTVTDDSARVDRYWTLDPTRELSLGSNEAYDRRFRELFSEAVRCRLRSTGSVGSYLSGGIDSSSIACIAREIFDQRNTDTRLHTFSAIFDDVAACDEREYITPVLNQGGFKPHFIHGDRISPLLNFDRHLAHQDEPFYPSLFMLIWGLLHDVREQDVTVVLTGYGGDQTLSSDPSGYLLDLVHQREYIRLFKEIKQWHDRYPEYWYRHLVRNELVNPVIPRSVRQIRHRDNDIGDYVSNTIASIDEGFARDSCLGERLRQDALSKPPRTQRDHHYHYLSSGEVTFNLELNDMASAAVGVETRFPYYDKRLVEFCLALPSDQKVSGGLGRIIARRALTGTLPSEVRQRDTKMEFSPNVIHGLTTYEMDRVAEILFDGPILSKRYFDRTGLKKSYETLKKESKSTSVSTSAAARDLLMATTLERWLQQKIHR